MNPFTPEQLRAIAKAQHLLIAAIGFNLLIGIGAVVLTVVNGKETPPPAQGIAWLVLILLSLGTLVVQIFAVFRLSRALGSKVAFLWCLGMFFPCLSLILLLVLNHRATRALGKAGIRVGLFGAGAVEVERALGATSAPPAL